MNPLSPLRACLACGIVTWSLGVAPVGAEEAPRGLVEAALRESLEQGLGAFNRGDFEGYLHDMEATVTYNGIAVPRDRLREINGDLKQSFGNLKMRYKSVTINRLGELDANVTTVAEFTGSTANYDATGLPATYVEVGEVTSRYRRTSQGWRSGVLQVAWNDSFIDIGRPFSMLGFTSLPALLGATQPYRFRLHVADDALEGTRVEYAYTVVPLATVISKDGAEEVYKSLRFLPLPRAGVDLQVKAPSQPGTYTHVLVVPKLWRRADQETLLGHKIYTRLVQVE
ncbi:MAG: hypothetical protein VKQ33_05605 [Candidatus Sericytochromatia bacterium]|nr:hypothetical protein [Candidatus Sericytochromatia bacterium]